MDQNTPRLINLAADIGEATDLSAQQPEKLKELTADYQAWNKEQAEPLWKPAPAPKRRQGRESTRPSSIQ